MLRRFREILARARADGFAYVFKRALRVAYERINPPWHVLYWTPTANRSGIGTPVEARLRIVQSLSQLDEQERAALGQSVGSSAEPLFADRLTRGCVLSILFHQDRVAGTLFAVLGRQRPFQHVPLTNTDAMVLDARIDPAFRGRGLYAVLLDRTARELAAMSIERLYIDTPADNERSLKTFRRLGYHFLYRYRKVRGSYRISSVPL